jgi:translation initiation factor IF-2
MATINQALTVEEATALAKQFGYEVQDVGFKEADVIPSVQTEEDAPDSLVTRPPVVTVMGHVDHGKTSLLDAIRETRVTASEAGGITQHIGAYEVKTKAGGHIVFLDTPGHEAFTSMRSRGAQATDIVILVVAADDGIMPQTVEAISHSKAAGVPIIVAVNKIDKQGADPQRVRYDLLQHDLISEELGGDVQMVNVSAHTKEGIPDLLEQVALLAEIMELQANPDKAASGVVIESHIKKGRGPVATILVSEGTLKSGDTIVAGMHFGRIRAMFNDHNKEVKVAGPSIPVEVIGLSGTPEPGERFDAVADDRDAKQIIEHRRLQKQRDEEAKSAGVRGWSFGVNEQKELNIILKADTQGTLEALKQSLGQLKHDEIKLNIPLAAVGGITESDVNLASTTNAVIFGFHVRAGNIAQRAAESEGVEIRVYRVIYELLDTAKQMMEEQLTPVYNEKPIGQAEIRKTFNIPKAGRIAGCYVTDGKVTRGALIRLYREDVQIYEGRVATLRRFKDDVKEVATGFECGIQIEGYQDIRPNDIIEAYEIEEIAQKLELL